MKKKVGTFLVGEAISQIGRSYAIPKGQHYEGGIGSKIIQGRNAEYILLFCLEAYKRISTKAWKVE